MERKQWTAGPHLLEFEPPDLFHCYVRGIALVAEIQESFKIMQEEVIPKVGDVYLIVHMENVGAEVLPVETRKYLLTGDFPWKGALVVGGTGLTRIAMNIFAQTINTLSGKRRLMKAVGTIEEALSCIDEWRSAGDANPKR